MFFFYSALGNEWKVNVWPLLPTSGWVTHTHTHSLTRQQTKTDFTDFTLYWTAVNFTSCLRDNHSALSCESSSVRHRVTGNKIQTHHVRQEHKPTFHWVASTWVGQMQTRTDAVWESTVSLRSETDNSIKWLWHRATWCCCPWASSLSLRPLGQRCAIDSEMYLGFNPEAKQSLWVNLRG